LIEQPAGLSQALATRRLGYRDNLIFGCLAKFGADAGPFTSGLRMCEINLDRAVRMTVDHP
jgi:hypothetical protein